ncbi:VTT domain-containing protein [Candidatus Woesearchaeota archaeon]|jgi:membrane protein YqaA with SNARE-associated domain|nr:VTT domain-containing protein [Candidatus Woesearchaeota archaeon]
MQENIKKHGKEIVKKIKDVKKKIKLRFFLFLGVIFLILALTYLFYPQIKGVIQSSIEVYGFIAVFIIALLSDILMQPIAPDFPMVSGIFFGLDPILITLTAIIASALSTMMGYYLGLKFGSGGFKKFYGEKRYKKIREIYLKYRFVIPIAAISPVPYVPVCWISGILKMNKIKFFLYAMIPRSLRLMIVAFSTYALFY